MNTFFCSVPGRPIWKFMYSFEFCTECSANIQSDSRVTGKREPGEKKEKSFRFKWMHLITEFAVLKTRLPRHCTHRSSPVSDEQWALRRGSRACRKWKKSWVSAVKQPRLECYFSSMSWVTAPDEHAVPLVKLMDERRCSCWLKIRKLSGRLSSKCERRKTADETTNFRLMQDVNLLRAEMTVKREALVSWNTGGFLSVMSDIWTGAWAARQGAGCGWPVGRKSTIKIRECNWLQSQYRLYIITSIFVCQWVCV